MRTLLLTAASPAFCWAAIQPASDFDLPDSPARPDLTDVPDELEHPVQSGRPSHKTFSYEPDDFSDDKDYLLDLLEKYPLPDDLLPSPPGQDAFIEKLRANATAKVDCAPCPESMPEALKEGENVTCHVVTVPQDQSDPYADETLKPISVFIYKIFAAIDNPKDNAIVTIAGGPGGSAPSYSAKWLLELSASLRQDVLAFDYRGVGMSKPALDCPLVGTDEQPNFVPLDCVAKYREEGYDLGHFFTLQAIADLEGARRNLCYETLTLYGYSYGSQFALRFADVFPESTSSLIIGGINAPSLDRRATVQSVFELRRIGERLADMCKQNRQCLQDFPDLDEDMEHFVDEYAAIADVGNLRKEALQIAKFLGQGAIDQTNYFPAFVKAYKEGDVATVQHIIPDEESETNVTEEDALNGTLLQTYVCWDYNHIKVASLEMEDELNEGGFPVPFSLDCEALGAEDEGNKYKALSKLATPDVPTMMFIGNADWSTVPAVGAIVYDNLPTPHKHLITTPGWSHLFAVLEDPCSRKNIIAFLHDMEGFKLDACTSGFGMDFPAKLPEEDLEG